MDIELVRASTIHPFEGYPPRNELGTRSSAGNLLLPLPQRVQAFPGLREGFSISIRIGRGHAAVRAYGKSALPLPQRVQAFPGLREGFSIAAPTEIVHPVWNNQQW